MGRLRRDAGQHGAEQRRCIHGRLARRDGPDLLPGKTFEDAFAQRNTGVVLAWKPGDKTFQVLPGTELSANNGIETSPDNREFYVASTTTKRIVAFARNGTYSRFALRSGRSSGRTTFAGLRIIV